MPEIPDIRKLGNVKKLCEIANVSRAGYYRWLRGADKKPRDYDDYLLVKEVFDQGKGKRGWRTVKMHLETDKGVTMNHKKVIRIKNKYNLVTKIRRRNPYKAILKKSHEHRTFDNLLNRNFKQEIPQKVFCTDITYLPFNNKMAYLSAVKDIATREIVAWNLTRHLRMDIVLNTVKHMKKNPVLPSLKNTLVHSDQGFHYTNPEYIAAMKQLAVDQSMSRRGNCIDNAPMETFFGHFKDEVDYKSCTTFEELKRLTAEYMEYYNTKRRQWDLKKMTPVEYRNYLLSAKS